MQDCPFDGAIDQVRRAIDAFTDDPLAYDHICLRIDDDEVCVKLCMWKGWDTAQTEDDRLAAIRRFEREMYDDSNTSAWIEVYPSSIEVGYRDVTGREVTCHKEYQCVFEGGDDKERHESIAECA